MYIHRITQCKHGDLSLPCLTVTIANPGVTPQSSQTLSTTVSVQFEALQVTSGTLRYESVCAYVYTYACVQTYVLYVLTHTQHTTHTHTHTHTRTTYTHLYTHTTHTHTSTHICTYIHRHMGHVYMNLSNPHADSYSLSLPLLPIVTIGWW